MADEELRGLEESLFGQQAEPTDERRPSLAGLISDWYRKAVARLPSSRATHQPPLQPPPSEPTK